MMILEPGVRIFTVDVQYKGSLAFVAVDFVTWGEDVSQVFLSKHTVPAPYRPGHFAEREGPVLVEAVKMLIHEQGITPDLLIVDGHGTAHPQKAGLACWVGEILNVSSIGVAKESLLPVDLSQLEQEKGAILPIFLKGEHVGFALRSRQAVKPIFVSAGFEISQSEALTLTSLLLGGYRIIEPMRRADQAARRFAKEELSP